MQKSNRFRSITGKSALIWVSMLLMMIMIGCEGGSNGVISDTSLRSYPVQMSQDTTAYIDLSRAALAGQLGIHEGAIAFESVAESDQSGDAVVVVLSVNGQTYEYKGSNGRVMPAGSSLPVEDMEQVADRPAIDLTLPTSIAADFNIQENPAAGAGADMPPWAVYPGHTVVSFSEYRHGDSLFAPQIVVYPVAELGEVNETAAAESLDLQELVATRPDPAAIESLPYLPVSGAAQMFHAREAYLDFNGGSGLRYITQYGQAAGPINNYELLYTFQGLSGDGTTYVAAVFPVAHPDLPDTSADYPGESRSDYDAYLSGIVHILNEAGPASFTPDLEALDNLVMSISVDAVAAETGNDPLEGTSWRLRRIGVEGADAAVLPGSNVTLTFSAENQAEGWGGCNPYGGSYVIEGDSVRFGELVRTLMDCVNDELMIQESDYLDALGSARHYSVNEGELLIEYANGSKLLTFDANEEDLEAPDTAVHSEADLVAQLEANGANVALNSESIPAADLFTIPGRQINVNGGALHVYLYPDAQAAQADAARISLDGYGLSPLPGSDSLGPTILDWAAPPRFYRWDNLIMLYVGEGDEVAHLLERVAGLPFAGT
jgi:heat shock protein HslJ